MATTAPLSRRQMRNVASMSRRIQKQTVAERAQDARDRAAHLRNILLSLSGRDFAWDEIDMHAALAIIGHRGDLLSKRAAIRPLLAEIEELQSNGDIPSDVKVHVHLAIRALMIELNVVEPYCGQVVLGFVMAADGTPTRPELPEDVAGDVLVELHLSEEHDMVGDEAEVMA